MMRMCLYDVVNREVMCCHDTATKILRQPRQNYIPTSQILRFPRKVTLQLRLVFPSPTLPVTHSFCYFSFLLKSPELGSLPTKLTNQVSRPSANHIFYSFDNSQIELESRPSANFAGSWQSGGSFLIHEIL